jgi:hypothetical protein
MTFWRREPILYFLGASVAVFAWYGLLQLNATTSQPEIRISAAEIARLKAQHGRMWQRPPSAAELDALIEDAVRTEVLAREAVAMGLDRDDTIIRRQLRLQIEALADDAGMPPASDQELREYFEAHRETFRNPPRYTFEQIYLDPARRGRSLDADVAALLESLEEPSAGVDVASLGDPTLLERSIAGADERDVAALFGASFAEALTRMPIGTWQGPVRSGYGVHLVRLVERSDPETLASDELRERVARDWAAAQAPLRHERFYQSLKQDYLVTLDDRVAERGR